MMTRSERLLERQRVKYRSFILAGIVHIVVIYWMFFSETIWVFS